MITFPRRLYFTLNIFFSLFFFSFLPFFLPLFCFSLRLEGRKKTTSRVMEESKYPRDLLRRIMSNDMSSKMNKYEEHKQEQQIELNLGLSLGGRFGVDKTKLVRSSSIALTFPFFWETSENDESFAPAVSLKRTASLPAEEEWRKKKELQTLRRLAAKRRRSEKQKIITTAAAAGEAEEEEEEEEVGPSSDAVIRTIPLWSAPKGKSVILGRSSSGLSELDSKPLLQGSSCGGEERGSVSNQDEQTNRSTTLRSLNSLTPEHASRISRAVMESMRKKPPIHPEDKGRESQMNHMTDMPCVFTKGDGPNGRKIDGILYRYAKGEEVRIMCVCHGTFLSPAEFVKHAGGGDVPNPLRHIVVNPAASSFL